MWQWSSTTDPQSFTSAWNMGQFMWLQQVASLNVTQWCESSCDEIRTRWWGHMQGRAAAVSSEGSELLAPSASWEPSMCPAGKPGVLSSLARGRAQGGPHPFQHQPWVGGWPEPELCCPSGWASSHGKNIFCQRLPSPAT